MAMNLSPSCRQPLQLAVLLIVSMFLVASSATSQQQQQQEEAVVTLPGCLDKCGNISIPFPFGVKPGCFLDGFQVTCNHSFQPPRLFLEFVSANESPHNEQALADNYSTSPVELMDISLTRSEARAYGLVRSRCFSPTNNSNEIKVFQATRLGGPFLLAATRNALVGVGWSTHVYLTSSVTTYTGTYLSCVSDTNRDPRSATDGICSGLGCCQALVTPATAAAGASTYFGIYPSYDRPEAAGGMYRETNPCSYGMLVETSWYNFSTKDMYGYDALPKRFPRGVPFVIDFAVRNGSCPSTSPSTSSAAGLGGGADDYACRSGNSFCANATNGPGYVCKCLEHYDGNPYIPDGCQDIDECALPDQYPCSSNGICINRLGGYDCPCKPGMKGDGKAGNCVDQFPLPAKVAVGAIGGLLAASVLVFVVLLRREKRRMKEYFDKNGGPLLKEASNIKIFKKEELKPILKSCNIVGKGCFGEVYKGLLDNKQVAVKKPGVNVDPKQKGQFANEVIIQSRMIHKNIVNLIGCCVEVDVPILVYEFVSKGSLDDILHGTSKEPLNLNQRLTIAAESAEGLAYMHSKTNNTILHGDVKPANILLNDDFVPKISDFGISRLIAIDKAQHENYIIGDRSYMDPVYLQTGLLTNKSDVYSFGVVLLELISRKKATYADNNNLVMSFLDAHKIQSRTTELFDKEITATRDIELLECVTIIAVECLKYDVDQRPKMTDVAERLLQLKRSRDN